MDGGSKRNVWENYTRSWSETDARKRGEALARCLHPEHTYADANTQTSGYQELSAYMSEFQKVFAGGKFVTSAFEHHHDHCLVYWILAGADGNVVTKGASYGRFGADGRLVQMVGFQP